MSGLIDRVGCFRGRILESGVGATKNGFPQFTARIAATQRYVDDKAEMDAFGLTEPGWVDWSEYQQEMVGYFVLFCNDKKSEGQLKPTFQLENIQRALGWDGSSFQVLGTTNWGDKDITFWVEESEYEGNVSLRISTIDAGDALPVRGLRTLDAEGLKDLDAKFAGLLVGKKTVAAPAKAPAKPATAAKAPPAATKPEAPAKTEAPKTEAKAPPKGPPQKAAAKAEEPPFETEGMTMEEAWNHVMANKGSASDDAVAEKWLDAAGAVAPGKAEEQFTPEEWAKVAQMVLSSLDARA